MRAFLITLADMPAHAGMFTLIEDWLIAHLSYRRVGGLHFVAIGRFGLTYYWRRPCP